MKHWEELAMAEGIELEEVRHGMWIKRDDGCLYPFWERYTCSLCGNHSDDTAYCPHCGAMMDSEEEE